MKHLLSLLLLLALPCALFAQECSLTNAKALKSSLGYKSRNGKYCEGLIENTNSAAVSFELISFTSGDIQYTAIDAETLIIKPLVAIKEPLTLLGSSFGKAHRYRLNYTFGTQDKQLDVPAANVISKATITSAHFGVYTSYPDGRQVIFCPVKQTTARANGTAKKEDQLFIRIAKNITTSSIQYACYPEDGHPGEKYNVPTGDIKDNSVLVRLKPGYKSGRYLLTLYYTQENGIKNDIKFHMLIP